MAIIDPFKPARPTPQSGGGIVDPFKITRPALGATASSNEAPKIQQPKGFTRSFGQGFERSLPENKSLVYGAAAATGGAVGADGLRDWGVENYKRVQEGEVAPLASEASFSDVLKGKAAFGDWAGDTLGNFAGQALQTGIVGLAGAAVGGSAGSVVPGAGNAVGAIAGGVGGVLARGAVKRGIDSRVKDIVAKQIAAGAVKEGAEAAAETAVRQKLTRQLGGATLATTGLNVGQEVGIGYTGRVEDAAAEGVPLTQTDALRAFAFGVPAGLLDTAAEGLALGKLTRGGTGVRMPSRIARGAAAGALTEGGTEAAQAVLERAGAARELTGEEAYLDYLENAAAGALGGATLGGVSSIRRPRRATEGVIAPAATPGSLEDAATTITRPAATATPAQVADGAVPVVTRPAAAATQAPPAGAPKQGEILPTEQPSKVTPPVAPVMPAWVNAETGEVGAPTKELLALSMRQQFAAQQANDKSLRVSTPQLAKAWGVPEREVKRARAFVLQERDAARRHGQPDPLAAVAAAPPTRSTAKPAQPAPLGPIASAAELLPRATAPTAKTSVSAAVEERQAPLVTERVDDAATSQAASTPAVQPTVGAPTGAAELAASSMPPATVATSSNPAIAPLPAAQSPIASAAPPLTPQPNDLQETTGGIAQPLPSTAGAAPAGGVVDGGPTGAAALAPPAGQPAAAAQPVAERTAAGDVAPRISSPAATGRLIARRTPGGDELVRFATSTPGRTVAVRRRDLDDPQLPALATYNGDGVRNSGVRSSVLRADLRSLGNVGAVPENERVVAPGASAPAGAAVANDARDPAPDARMAPENAPIPVADAQSTAPIASEGPFDAVQVAPVAQDRRVALEQRAAVDALPADAKDAEIDRLRAAVEQLQGQLDTDPLTGVRSRAAYERDKASAGGVAIVDLKLFKGYNTVGGQTGGDIVLREFGRAMGEAAGAARAYRSGGDEFAFLAATPGEVAASISALNRAASEIYTTLVKDGVGYVVDGVPFTAGVGNDEQSADADLSRRKGDYDRNALPESIRRADTDNVGAGRSADAQRSDDYGSGAPEPERSAEPDAGAVVAPQETNETPPNGGVSVSGVAEGVDSQRPELTAAQPAREGADIEAAAAEAATSPENDRPEPTEAQRDAGNYAKGHIRINGLDVSIENPAGTSRRPEWPPLANHYGYFRLTEGADGDHVDVFLGDRAQDSALPVFVIDQIDPKTGKFDEHKVILGAATGRDARRMYQANYAKGWKGFGAITPMKWDAFKAWVQSDAVGAPASAALRSATPARQRARAGIAPNGARVRVVDGKPQYVLGARETLEAYFKPGTLVPAYGGTTDKVIGFAWNDGSWSVRVQEQGKPEDVDPRSDARWDEREHRTAPALRDVVKVLGAPQVPAAKTPATTKKNATHAPFSQPEAQSRAAVATLDESGVRDVVAAVTREWGSNGPGVRVVSTQEQLPASAKRDPSYRTANGFIDADGRVYLVASSLQTAHGVRAVLAHEAVGHFGINKLVDDAKIPGGWKKLAADIARLRAEGLGSERMQAVLRDVAKRYPDADADTFARETLAVMAERDVRNGLIDRAIAAVRAFVRKIMPSTRFSEAELRQMLVRSDRFIRSGETYAQQRERVQAMAFSQPGGTVDALDDALSAPPATTSSFKEWLHGKWQDMKPGLFGWLTFRHLLELAEPILPGAGRLGDLTQRIAADRNQMLEDAGELSNRLQKWAAAPGVAGLRGKYTPTARALFDLMHESTIKGSDPSKPYSPVHFQDSRGRPVPFSKEAVDERKKVLLAQRGGRPGEAMADLMDEVKLLDRLPGIEKARAAAYPKLVAKWQALTPEAQKFYTELRDFYASQSAATEAALVQRIAALDVPDSYKKSLTSKIRYEFETQRLQGVYFPLQRFGDFWVAASKPASKATDAPESERVPEEVYLMFEGAKDWTRAQADLKAKGYTITASGRQDSEYRSSQAPSGTFIAEVIQELQKSKVSQAAQDQVYQIFLKSLPELSMRKHSIHRKGTAGYSDDALRAFARTAFHGAHQISKLRYAHELQSTVDAMQVMADNRRKDGAAPDVVNSMDTLLGEIRRRIDWILSPTDSKVANFASAIGFTYFLGLTPAAAIVNLTQGPLITYPVLGAKYGFDRAGRMLAAATRDAIATGGNIERRLTSDDERMALRTLRERGDIQRTAAHSLAGIAEGSELQASPIWAKAMHAISFLFSKVEEINRQAAGLAAYRMARLEGQNFDAAVRYASEIINGTHFDFSNANRARQMQSPTKKVLFQFKQYALNTSWVLGRAMFKSLAGETPEVQRFARRKLAGILGMSAVFSGAMGLPFMGIAKAVANSLQSAFGDDDEPWDFETEVRAFLADYLGVNAARIVADGVVNELGADVANRVGMDQMWFRDPDRELEGQGLFHYLLEQAAGPMGGLVKNVFVGKQQMEDGHVWRGFETMAPKALKDAMKAIRFNTEGANTLRGDPLIEDVSTAEQFVQLLGFSPTRMAEQYRVNRAAKNYEQHYLDRRQSLLNALALAVRMQDDELRSAALTRIQAFNRAVPELALSPQSIRQSLRARARYSAQAEAGVVLNKRVADRVREQIGANN